MVGATRRRQLAAARRLLNRVAVAKNHASARR